MDDVKEYLHELAQPPHSSSGRAVPAHEARQDELVLEGQLAVDVYRSGHTLILEAPIGGVHSEDLDVEVNPSSITIRGHRHRDHHTEKGEYIIDECHWGSFSREVTLPVEVDVDKTQASVKNGVLRVKMPILG
jgi:HSP20 family protein